MTEKVTFVSVNLRGAQLAEKRKDVLNFLKQKQFSIYFLQDTHFTKKEENYIRSQWGFDCYFSSYSSEARGVAIMLNNNFEFTLHEKVEDTEGNKLILDITINKKRMTLINIYGPNKDSPDFFSNIKEDIDKFGNNVILAGDFNLVLDPSIDTQNYLNVNNPQARTKVIDIISECGLVDCWRELNAEKLAYTWTRPNSNKRARLDFFLISEELFSDIEDSNILPGYRTDHSMILLSFKFNKFNRGRSYWKFNNSLLNDIVYVNEIKTVINTVKQQYASSNQPINLPSNDIPNSEFKFDINDQLFFEVLLMEIRGKTISYSAFLKKQNNKEEEQILKDIQQLESELVLNHDDLKAKNKKLEDLRQKKMEGVKLRSKAKWIDEGEKVTKYFCNLENRNFISKCMPSLITSTGDILTDQNNILHEAKEFYKNLYSEKPVEDVDLKYKLRKFDVQKLKYEEQLTLEGEITYAELLNSLKHANNNKSPGSDGFTMEFFKFFWKDLGSFMLRSLNYGYLTNELSVTQKEGIITCIPKQNKDRQLLKNWRPISLLNCTYKLASACIATRLKTVLPKLISDDQTGFMTGRYIGENIRIIYDLFYYTEKENIPALLLLVDFEKAFDSVSWVFINKVLNYFNFGPSFQRWINLFLKNIKSCVHINGHLSQWFFLQRGCRQGDPISPYIFLLCAEILAILIKNNSRIKGIKVGDKEFVISQYADDTSFILDGTEQSLEQALLVLKFYAKISGLGVNVDKTSVIWFGSMRNSEIEMCPEYNLKWEKGNFSMLGIIMSTNLKEVVNINYESKISSVSAVFNAWSKRVLTPLGKIIVIKSLALSKLNHLFIGLPNPSADFIKRLQNMCYNFLWKNGPDRIKRLVITQDYGNGGLRMISISQFINALKLSWIRRQIFGTKSCFEIHNVLYPFAKKFLIYGSEYIKNKLEIVDNPFWQDTYKAMHDFALLNFPTSWNEFLSVPLWFNHNIKVGRQSCFIREWAESGVRFINDLMDRNGNFYNQRVFEEKFSITTNFITYHGIIAACESYLEILSFPHLPTNADLPTCSSLIYPIIKNSRGCRTIYDILIKKDILPTSTIKWEREVNFLIAPDWKKFFKLPFKVTKNSNLLWFQIRLIHRILPTNYLLTKMNIKENDQCTFCLNETETLIHLFCHCRHVQTFWIDFKKLLSLKNIHIPHEWNEIDILFGSLKYDSTLNQLIFLAKQFIYRKKNENAIPVFDNFKSIIKHHYQVEKYNAVKHSKFEKFETAWKNYKMLTF